MIVVLQNETGCALVFAAFIIVMYREGLVQGIVLFFGLLVVLSIIIGLKYPGFIIGVAVVLLLIAAFRLMLVRRTVKQFLLTAIIVSLFQVFIWWHLK